MLPGLARLHGYGFVVDVANVRAATLDEEDDEDDDENNDEGQEGFLLRGTAKAALESCISGDGEAPLKLKIAAVACAGTGVVCGVPVQHMREDTMPPPQAPDDAGNGTGGGRGKGTPRAMTELDLRHKEIQGPAAMLISYLIPAVGALTRVDVRGNYIAGDGAAQLAAAVLGNLKIEMFNEIPIKEMRANSLTELDLNGKGVGVEGGMVVVGLIPVMGAMTSIDLSNNKLCNVHAAKLRHRGREVHGTYTAEGIIAIADALRVNGGLTSLDLSYNMLCGVTTFGHGTYTAEGITSIAEALRVNGGLTKLSLAKNKLGEEGTKFLCDALVGNNTLKELDLSGDSSFRGTSSNIGGTAGAKRVANLLLVNGGLTRVDVRHNNIAGDGAAQLAAAVLGNFKIEMFNEIPIKEMRADSFTKLDLKEKGVGVEGGMAVAGLMPVMGGLTKMSLAGNQLEEEGTKAICEALEQNKTLKELDIRGNRHGNIGESAGAKHVAKMLGVNGGLTALDLSSNDLKDEGVSAVCEAIQSNKETKLTSLNFKNIGIGPVGANAVAAMVAVTGGLTRMSLARNKLGEEGTKAICEALEQNKTLTELDLSGTIGSNIGGAAGAKHVADMLRVNGALTVANLLGNHLDLESAKMLIQVAKQKGISLCGIRRDQTTAAFSDKYLKPPDAILLASDLSQAVVTGVLTSIDLSGNQLCGIGTDYWGNEQGTYTAEGIKAIADALHVNGGLTKISFASNKLGEEGTKAICEALEQNKTLKELDISGNMYGSNIGGSAGVKHVAKMLGVNGALTSIDLTHNNLCGEVGWECDVKGLGCLNGGLRRWKSTPYCNWDACDVCYTTQHGRQLELIDSSLGIIAIANALRVNGGLTVANLLGNQLDAESAKMLAEVAKQKGISLCGIQRDQTTADIRSKDDLKLPDAILLASDLSQAVVTGGLTALDVSNNCLEDEGVSAVCEAIQSNKETKLASLNFRNNDIGPVGANAVAAMVAVTGALTKIE
jgi:Ran GTPase-activating protein (RanGAP) involved in mRNA processing and transport